MKEYAKRFYKSKSWNNLSYGYARSKNFICERCEGSARLVHHKIHLNPSNIDDIRVSLNRENLELLCQDCHNKEHFRRYGNTIEGLSFDDEGSLVGMPPIQLEE